MGKPGLIWLLVLLSLSIVRQVKGQQFYSEVTSQERESVAIQSFELNDSVYILGYWMCDTVSHINCGAIFRIDEDGRVIYRKNLGPMRLAFEPLLVEKEHLVITGSTDSTIWLAKYDGLFERTEYYEYPYILQNPDEYFWIREIISIGDRYIIGGDENNYENVEKAFIYSISKNNPANFDSMSMTSNLESIQLYDLSAIDDSTFLTYQTMQYGANEYHCEFRRFSDELELMSVIPSQVESGGSVGHCVLLDNNHCAIYRLGGPPGLVGVDMDGELLWGIDLESLLEEYKVFSLRIVDMRLDRNGDIVVSGEVSCFEFDSPDSYRAGIIAKISKQGELQWSRIYREGANGYLLNMALTSMTEHSDGYLFVGYQNTYPVFGVPNYLWTLRTDEDGCINPDTCDPYQLVSVDTDFLSRNDLFEIVGNPVVEKLVVKSLIHETLSVRVFNNSGRHIAQLIGGEFAIMQLGMSGLPSGVYYVAGYNASGEFQIEKLLKH